MAANFKNLYFFIPVPNLKRWPGVLLSRRNITKDYYTDSTLIPMGKRSTPRARWLLLLLFAGSCHLYSPEFTEVEDVMGYAPVYQAESVSTPVTLTSPRSILNPGKIYIYGEYLLVNEINEGIHVFDNSDAAAPEAIGFL